jgi:hypothetical protein
MFALPLQDGCPALERAHALGFADARGVVGVVAQGVALGGPAGLAGAAVALLGLAEGKAREWLLNTALSARFGRSFDRRSTSA